ncbi:uncharacterized protein LOC100141857 isoform X2 [Tribolium castaneum]|uniref:uncharacterized protein LOC100141857 isoform X2 n=1 Tax=Tribolium castaneum TaxID=7070 RepID=UPI0030FE1953
MSRRARLEEEKQRHLNSELEEEENRLKAQRERIYAPIIWKRLGSGIRIQDLKPVYYDQVLRIIQECYFQEEVLCRNSNLGEDPDSIKSFLNMVLFYLKDRTSIIALDESLGLQLFLSAVDVARSLNIPVVMGILSCWTLQKLAKRIGMKTVFEIDYVGWRDRFNEMIFDDPGIGNYTCAVMAGPVPPPPEVEPPPKVDEVEEKLTREEKRKAKEKKKRKQGTK